MIPVDQISLKRAADTRLTIERDSFTGPNQVSDLVHGRRNQMSDTYDGIFSRAGSQGQSAREPGNRFHP